MNANDNGKGATPPGVDGTPPPLNLDPENILHQVTVVVTKDGAPVVVGSVDDLPLMLHLLAMGVDIMSGMVAQALPKLIIPATGPLPPGTIPFGRGGRG